MVEVQKLELFCDSCGARATLCGNRRSRGTKTRVHPSAGIGVVEVQKLKVCFSRFCGARATLCGDRRGRGAKTLGFVRFCASTCSRRGTVRIRLCLAAEIVRVEALSLWRRAILLLAK